MEERTGKTIGHIYLKKMLRKEFLDNLIKTEKTLFDEVFLSDGNVNVGCNIFLQALGGLLSHDGQVSKEKNRLCASRSICFM